MLPSRTSFIKTGLVPAQILSDDCIICTDTLTDPVSLAICEHTFCKTCITKWLSQRARNTCPYCRAILFALDDSDQAPVQGDRMVLMSQAMSHAGLLGGRYMRFSDNIHINISDLYRAAAQANLWLGEEFHPAAAGPAVIERERLGVQVVAMGNLIRGYAQASGRTYTQEQIGHWKVIVKALYGVVERWNGKQLDAMVIPRLLKEEVRNHLVEGGALAAEFFEDDVRPGTVAADLDVLLQYLAKKAAERFAAREDAGREARREPTALEKVSAWFRDRVL